MKLNHLIFLSLLVAAIGVSSCKKDDKSNRDLLLEGQWRIALVRVDPPVEINGVLITSVPLELDACEADDAWTFQAAGTILISEGPTKCDPADPDTYPGGTWSLLSDDKTMTINMESEVLTFDLTSINSTEMQLRIQDPSLLDEDLPTTSNYYLVFTNVK
ncbi:MAG: lipocalin family protein [Lewinellaceae bacterium]|nr:lipocalin family protein [Saprospiraceae bacterium]MCB9313583.1 lipocalin family protein [Lewinellaceae bacterium]HRW76586.1 lipocalin family protein [Saprospiraceae bacterium]